GRPERDRRCRRWTHRQFFLPGHHRWAWASWAPDWTRGPDRDWRRRWVVAEQARSVGRRAARWALRHRGAACQRRWAGGRLRRPGYSAASGRLADVDGRKVDIDVHLNRVGGLLGFGGAKLRIHPGTDLPAEVGVGLQFEFVAMGLSGP